MRWEKSSPTKVGKENLRVCQLEIDKPVGEKIPLRQTVRVYGGGFLKYLGIPLETNSGEIINS